jgi:hypothetical protein
MKKVLYSDIYGIREVRNPEQIYTLVREARSVLSTYNQIMTRYESGEGNLGVIFIASKNNIVFQHLPLFCDHFGIQLYALPEDAEDVFNGILQKKYVNIVGIGKDDPAYGKFLRLAERGL